MRAKSLLGFGIWVVSFFAFAPDGLAQYQFDTWTTENGLPQNSINDILQTHDGYLWLATNGGLARFDGLRFAVFDRSTEGIKGQRVRALLEDSKGTLWAGTEDGKLIRYRDGKFKTYTAEDGLPNGQASMIEEDDEGNLWITWHGAVTAVTKFDGERFVNYSPGDFPHGVSGDIERRYPWWSQDSESLYCLVKGRVQTYSFQSELLKAPVTRVSQDFHGNLWIQTRGAGVVKAAQGPYKLYTTRDGLPSNDLAGSFLEDCKGSLWFAVYNRRALYRIRDGKPEWIAIPTVSKLYEDREGSTWIGTLAGLYRVRQPSITLLTEGEGLSDNWVYPILQDRAGAIWIGSGGLNRYERGRFMHYRTGEGLPSDLITCIFEDNSGRLWVSTGGGVSYFNNGRFKRYDDEYGFLKHLVRAIHQDRAGHLWFGTDGGLVKSIDGNFIRYTSQDGLSHNRITALLEDRAGALWIGTQQGLSRLQDGVFTAYTERDGFIGNQVRAIHEDSDGVLWIGTYDGGLYRLKDERLTRYTRKEGLHDNGVFQILEDDAGNLWMGCNRGIYRVSRQELNDFAEGRALSITSVGFGTKDGLATLECNGGPQPSGVKAKDGKLWFPTMGGVAVVDPKAVQFNTYPPPVIIEEFRLNNEPIRFLGGVEVPPGNENFEIRYTAPSFIKPEQVKFRYKLVGLDEDWLEADDRRTVNYNRIPAGRYRFLVIAANSDGVWNTEGASIDIVVVPPFWRRWWFLALATLLTASIVFLIYERRVWRLQREHALQKAFSQQLIDSQESERRRISNEMHDSLGQDLNIIKMRALLSKERLNDNPAVKVELDEITLLAEKIYGEMKEIAYGLRPYYLDKIGLTKSIERMVRKVGRACDIEFDTDIAEIDNLFEESAQINIYRIVQEGVNNIVKHSQASRAKVTIERGANLAEIRIEDNGTGFQVEPIDLTDAGKKSFGLMGIRERAKMLGGDVEMHSANGQGTTIIVKFRVKEGRYER